MRRAPPARGCAAALATAAEHTTLWAERRVGQTDVWIWPKPSGVMYSPQAPQVWCFTAAIITSGIVFLGFFSLPPRMELFTMSSLEPYFSALLRQSYLFIFVVLIGYNQDISSRFPPETVEWIWGMSLSYSERLIEQPPFSLCFLFSVNLKLQWAISDIHELNTKNPSSRHSNRLLKWCLFISSSTVDLVS